jgi:acyl-CoA synthetase (AMP-forming)/AMP-acid ligase II
MTTFTGPPAESEAGIGSLTIGGLLAEACAAHRKLEAVAARGADTAVTRWSYDDLWRESRRYAKGFLATGAGRGTRVGLLVANRAEWLAAAFGVALSGGVIVPFSTFATGEELEQLLAHSGVSVLIAQPGFARAPLEALAADVPGLLDAAAAPLFSTRFPQLRRVYDIGGSMTELLVAGDVVPDEVLDAAAAAVTPADDAIIIYTSGSTELPKGVLHAHRSPALQSWRFASRQRLLPGDRVYSAFPFFWTAGFAMVLGSTLAAGGCLCIAETFSAEEALRTMQDEKVTIVHVWPHHSAAIRDCPTNAEFDISTVRNDPQRFRPSEGDDEQVSLGSSRAGYGMSETFTIVTSAPVDADRDILDESNGFLLPGNAMRIRDPQTGALLGPGQEGEILVKGTTMMRGYVGLPAEACFDSDGFFHSGDTGYLDERGLLHWTGRVTELIKTGGANVSPVELETLLARHPGLLEAAVVGVPDDLLGEVVVACVVARPDAQVDETVVRAYVKEHVSSFKVPKRVLFFADGELPNTGSDKVQHAELRRIALERLAQESTETATA